jgi:putative transposase
LPFLDPFLPIACSIKQAFETFKMDLNNGKVSLEERVRMKQGQFNNEQIVALLQEAERGEKTVAALCKERGISEATFYAWRKKFGGLQTRDIQRLRELEKENARLKRLLAERVLELDVVKEALTKNF